MAGDVLAAGAFFAAVAPSVSGVAFEAFLAADFLAGDFVAVTFFAGACFAGALVAADFLAGALLAGDFVAVALSAGALLAGAFVAVALLADDFFAVAFVGVAFEAGAFVAAVFVAGAFVSADFFAGVLVAAVFFAAVFFAGDLAAGAFPVVGVRSAGAFSAGAFVAGADVVVADPVVARGAGVGARDAGSAGGRTVRSSARITPATKTSKPNRRNNRRLTVPEGNPRRPVTAGPADPSHAPDLDSARGTWAPLADASADHRTPSYVRRAPHIGARPASCRPSAQGAFEFSGRHRPGSTATDHHRPPPTQPPTISKRASERCLPNP
ncbi:MAG TPA: hypothetical protein VFY82_13270 [Acidimicrobiales bacterium]|nr:hypothetical protein [Acidimicrobiales bacterium]